jgi:hypothetical protein
LVIGSVDLCVVLYWDVFFRGGGLLQALHWQVVNA